MNKPPAMRKPSVNKNRTSDQRDAQLEEVAKYTRRGYTQYQIAERVGVSFSQVAYDQKIIRQRWRDNAVKEWDDLVQEKLEQLREVRREAWEAWERSKEDAEREVEEHGVEDTDEDEGDEDKADAMTSFRLLKKIITRSGRLPDNAYLQTICKTLEQECKITGLGEDENAHGGATVILNWGQLEESARKVQPVDRVKERLEAAERLPDAELKQAGGVESKNGEANTNGRKK